MLLWYPQQELSFVPTDFCFKTLFPKAVSVRWTAVPAFRWLSVMMITEDSEKRLYHSVQISSFYGIGCFRNKNEAIALAIL